MIAQPYAAGAAGDSLGGRPPPVMECQSRTVETGRFSGEFWTNPTILWRTLARQERFSREPPEKRSRDSSTLATVLQRTRAVLRRSVSVKQQSGAKRRSMSRQVVEKAGSARACALLQRAVWGVENRRLRRRDRAERTAYSMGNRSRRERRIGAVTALEWALSATLRRDEVSSAVTAASTATAAPTRPRLRRPMRRPMTAKPAVATRVVIAMTTTTMATSAGAVHRVVHDDRRSIRSNMRSMMRRRATRLPTGTSAKPTAGARSAMPEASASVRAAANAPASGARPRAPREARARMTAPPQRRRLERKRTAPRAMR